ncbi:hypothetical protein IYY11_18240 [Methylocystis sp. H62]|uniref:hypothetical protein n=1 Tax=Methylocystis sp. H62 TaxID=2785789 RepID=UPI0018C2C940|nr:hypothetical protein [Methylocystis sp. H62]MBG0795296.1 hypothetical protein [Methylocystis sp. H62]
MRILALALAVCLAAAGASAKQPRSQKANNEQALSGRVGDPNGRWNIEATTTVGECRSLIPPSFDIVGNKIAAAPGPAASIWGYVDDKGTIVARFTGDGERVVRFHGTLRGGMGSGPWSSSTDLCGGTWRASRSAAAAQ